MKISRDTPDQLIIENNPILLALLISTLGLLFLGAGLLLVGSAFWSGIALIAAGLSTLVIFNLVFIRRSQFIFDRPRNQVKMRRKSLLGFSKHTWDLAYLDRAIIQTSHTGDSPTYRAALVFVGGMEPGTVPLTVVYSSGKSAERAADAVNDWLAGRAPPIPR